MKICGMYDSAGRYRESRNGIWYKISSQYGVVNVVIVIY